MLRLDTGEKSIGASDMTLQFCLLPYLERFNNLYPKIKIKVTNGPTPETLAYLAAGRIDFGVVSAPVTEGGHLDIIPVAKIRDVFVAGERFAALRDRQVEPTEIANYPVILLEQNTSTRRYIDAFFDQNGTTLSPEFELATSELIVQFALKGLGIGCVVRDFAEKLLDDGALFELQLKTPIPQRDICIVTSSRNPISPAGKKLLDMMLP
jgi:DNA-binding transcriptional LysR family regulator